MFSIVVPVYNEAEILRQNAVKLVDCAKKVGEPFEVLICSNGSTDATDDIGRRLESEYGGVIRFFSIPEKGVGHAFVKMVSEARYDKIISIDADLTTDMAFIDECTTLLDEYDMVIGSKRMGEQYRSIARIILSKGYYYLVKILFKMEYGDYSIGAKGYMKGMIEPYLGKIDYGSSYVIEVAYMIHQRGKIIEIPVFCSDTRRSKFNIFHEVAYRFNALISFWFRRGR
ncbi:MAG: glycosyltransferase family 2 protein [Candidatus Altiarchaeota archaeon]|nr:glycosyltransferase family 2 protein [Candidatus Altiarchaeota archaeon]